MVRSSKKRTKRNNYKNKQGKYKKVRKTKRRTSRNRQRGRGGFFNKLRRSIKSKGRDLKSKVHTYMTDGKWANQPQENINTLREIRNNTLTRENTNLDKSLKTDKQYQESKKISDKYLNRMNTYSPRDERPFFSGAQHLHEEAEKEMKKRKDELEATTPQIKDRSISSNDVQ